jgi:hypothetical protein
VPVKCRFGAAASSKDFSFASFCTVSLQTFNSRHLHLSCIL